MYNKCFYDADINKDNVQIASRTVILTPESKKIPICINLETPEVPLPKSYSGNASNRVVDSSTHKQISRVQLLEDLGFDNDFCDYEGLFGYKHSCGERSYDGMTDSEDSRLRYGLSGDLITIYLFIEN